MTMAARTRATTSSRSCGFWECAALRHSSQSPNATASLSASIAPSRHSFFGSRPSIPSRNYGSHCTCSSTSTTKNGSCRSTVSSRLGKPARPSLTLGPSRLEYTHRVVQETVRHYSPHRDPLSALGKRTHVALPLLFHDAKLGKQNAARVEGKPGRHLVVAGLDGCIIGYGR
jgi:hypothetical protein